MAPHPIMRWTTNQFEVMVFYMNKTTFGELKVGERFEWCGYWWTKTKDGERYGEAQPVEDRAPVVMRGDRVLMAASDKVRRTEVGSF